MSKRKQRQKERLYRVFNTKVAFKRRIQTIGFFESFFDYISIMPDVQPLKIKSLSRQFFDGVQIQEDYLKLKQDFANAQQKTAKALSARPSE